MTFEPVNLDGLVEVSTEAQAKRIVVTASYDEQCQAIADSMLAYWAHLDVGAYGFRGYDNLRRIVNNLSGDDLIEVAQNIEYRRHDARLEGAK